MGRGGIELFGRCDKWCSGSRSTALLRQSSGRFDAVRSSCCLVPFPLPAASVALAGHNGLVSLRSLFREGSVMDVDIQLMRAEFMCFRGLLTAFCDEVIAGGYSRELALATWSQYWGGIRDGRLHDVGAILISRFGI